VRPQYRLLPLSRRRPPSRLFATSEICNGALLSRWWIDSRCVPLFFFVSRVLAHELIADQLSLEQRAHAKINEIVGLGWLDPAPSISLGDVPPNITDKRFAWQPTRISFVREV